MTETSEYQGGELELFAHAHSWKRYLAGRMSPYLRGTFAVVVDADLGDHIAGMARADRRSADIDRVPDLTLTNPKTLRLAPEPDLKRSRIA
jgi:hypothetical protein